MWRKTKKQKQKRKLILYTKKKNEYQCQKSTMEDFTPSIKSAGVYIIKEREAAGGGLN
jgi:hypothetical protein